MSQVLRFDDWTDPVPHVAREVLSALPDPYADLPPILFVPGPGHGAWVFAEHWLRHTASRGFPAHALSLRADGGLRAYAHDVVQVAAGLPRQTVLVGHGAGAVIVAHALARYPARAAVLVSPGLDRWTALRANPFGTLPALFGGTLRFRRRQLFSDTLPAAQADQYLARIGRAKLLPRGAPPRPVGRPPVLIAGSPDDRVVPRSSLDRTAARYGAAPLLFPGMGYDLMLDTTWVEPIDAILDWLVKELAA
jgi:pimeloyl-ACP methyl ester carboxylesterase